MCYSHCFSLPRLLPPLYSSSSELLELHSFSLPRCWQLFATCNDYVYCLLYLCFFLGGGEWGWLAAAFVHIVCSLSPGSGSIVQAGVQATKQTQRPRSRCQQVVSYAPAGTDGQADGHAGRQRGRRTGRQRGRQLVEQTLPLPYVPQRSAASCA